jgi:hypothetical protein
LHLSFHLLCAALNSASLAAFHWFNCDLYAKTV